MNSGRAAPTTKTLDPRKHAIPGKPVEELATVDSTSLRTAGAFTHPSGGASIPPAPALGAKAITSVQAQASIVEATLDKPLTSAPMNPTDEIPTGHGETLETSPISVSTKSSFDSLLTGPGTPLEKFPKPALRKALEKSPAGPRQALKKSLTPPQTSSLIDISTGHRQMEVESPKPAQKISLDGFSTGARLKPRSGPDADRKVDSSLSPDSRLPPVVKENLKDPALLQTDHPGNVIQTTESEKYNADATSSGGHHPVILPPTIAGIRNPAADPGVPSKQSSRLPMRQATSPVTSKKRPSALEIDMDISSVSASSTTSIVSQDSPSKKLKLAATDSVSQEVERYLGLKGTSGDSLPLDLMARISPGEGDKSPTHSLLDRLT